jgi:hypothetical protein
LKQSRSRQVFKTLVKLVIHCHQNESISDHPNICCSYVIFEHPYIVKTATLLIFCFIVMNARRPQWQRGLGRGSAAARLLRLLFWVLSEAWISVSIECCVLSGRGICVGVITRPKQSYRLWCISMSVILKPR